MTTEKTVLGKLKAAALGVGLTPLPNAPAPDAAAGGGEMPRSVGAVARDYGAGGGGGGAAPGVGGAAAAPGAGAPASNTGSAVTRKVLGNLAGFPFDLAALKTGNAHWHLKPEEGALLSEAAEGVAASYGVGLDAKSNPWACLLIGYIGFGLPRVAEEMRLLRLAMEKEKPKA